MFKIPQLLPASLLICACSTFHMVMPLNFDADVVRIHGNTTNLEIGDWRLTGVRRSNTGAGSITSKTGYDGRRRQTYRFTAAKGSWAAAVLCNYSAGGRIPARGAYDYVEDADLRCTISGSQAWQLDVSNDPGARLSGQLQGVGTYEVRGIAAPTGPVNGFYVDDASGGTVAAVQLAGDPRVFFARTVTQQERDRLMPALAALLLLDEKTRAM